MKLLLYIIAFVVFCICCVFFTGTVFCIGCCIGIAIIVSIISGNFTITTNDNICPYCKGSGEIEIIGFHNDTIKMKCNCQIDKTSKS